MSQDAFGAATPEQPREGLDLSAARNPQAAGSAGAAPAGAPAAGANSESVVVSSIVQDVTEQSFNDIVELSTRVPVVVDLWADWCEPCKQLSPILEKVTREFGGRIVLAKVDVDKNPQIQQAFGAQSIPTVVAIVKGQPVPLFTGAVPESQVRGYFDELDKVAAQNGVNGRAVATGDDEPAEAPLPPLHQEAYDALEKGDLDGAANAFTRALKENPGDDDAKAGLAQVGLLQRTRDVDLDQARAAAADQPSNLDAQFLVADLDVSGGHIDDAFARMLTLIRTTAGDDRERVRVRLLELFEVVGAADPRVTKARASLTRALF
ncbi:tetratricopeptide repeat protein [Spelaeicoccus albus]|uniref:Putative thioredoxin n=1 Tax=Spelaeicoccus albus TaxID=1280376 RepID=A0A7Z0IHF1_9MICO|nr:tetratricopeptide repeat protein [Spelaeicoccus albus]NYI67611.1 putative thioredoxin [Spelaeicoccus albus]